MGTFRKVTESTELAPKMKIREFNEYKDDYDNYVIGNHQIDSDTYEVYPDGVDYLNKEGVLFSYPRSKMISRDCEYWEE